MNLQDQRSLFFSANASHAGLSWWVCSKIPNDEGSRKNAGIATVRGRSLPASFGDIRDQHVHQRGDAALTPDIAKLHQSNREQTSRFGNAKPSQETVPMVSPVREEVRTKGNKIRSDAESSRADFDAKAEIIKTDDGTLASKKSLLVQSGKQVGKDAGATLDNAKDVVKDLLRK